MAWRFELNGPIGQENQRNFLRLGDIGTDGIPVRICSGPVNVSIAFSGAGCWAMPASGASHRLAAIPLLAIPKFLADLAGKDIALLRS